MSAEMSLICFILIELFWDFSLKHFTPSLLISFTDFYCQWHLLKVINQTAFNSIEKTTPEIRINVPRLKIIA